MFLFVSFSVCLFGLPCVNILFMVIWPSVIIRWLVFFPTFAGLEDEMIALDNEMTPSLLHLRYQTVAKEECCYSLFKVLKECINCMLVSRVWHFYRDSSEMTCLLTSCLYCLSDCITKITKVLIFTVINSGILRVINIMNNLVVQNADISKPCLLFHIHYIFWYHM